MTRKREGFNLIEVMVALSVAATVLLALGAFIGQSLSSGVGERDRAYAMQKALQMMEELAAYKLTSSADVGISKFGQGATTYSFQMSTETQGVAYSAFSGNPKINGYYKYVRNIKVANINNDATAKEVTVTVYKAALTGTPTPDPKYPKPLAVVSSHLRVAPGLNGPTQVIDCYVLAIENLPYIYRKSDDNYYYPSSTEAILAFEQAVRTFQSANAGIQLRTHYITRLSMGRDAQYRPYINDGMGLTTGTRDPLKYAYTYPGKLISAGDSTYYYDPNTIAGNITVGDSSGNATVSKQKGYYPLADQFNHCVQYAIENTNTNLTDAAGAVNASYSLYGSPTAPSGVPAAGSVSQLSLRQFLDDLLQDSTGKYRNAIIVNLHGELFPCLPLRNYADAAKDPNLGTSTSDQWVRKRRLVTHPYKLNFPVNDTTKPVTLVTHPFLETGENTPQASGDQHHVKVDTSLFPTWAQDARIRIKGIKPYLVTSGLPFNVSSPPYTAPTKEEAVNITAIQRMRDNGTTELVYRTTGYPGDVLDSGDDKTEYDQIDLWPRDTADMGGSGDNDVAATMHSGPHLESNHSVSTLKQPRWIGDDLVIDLKEFDYDAHWVQDSAGKFGIKDDSPDYLLHHMQYFPDPYLAFLDVEKDGDDKWPRNSARLLIQFVLNNAASGKRFEVITQLKKYNRTKDNVAGTEDFLDYQAHPDLLTDPTISRAYFYAGFSLDANQKLYFNNGTDTYSYQPTIPWSDQVQLVGDPRHMPYEDMREKGNLNHFYTDFTAGKEMYKDVNNAGSKSDTANDWSNPPGITSGTSTPPGKGKPKKPKPTNPDFEVDDSANSWNTVKYDGPAYFRMWREAMYRNNMMFMNMAGEPVAYVGMGGEFSLYGTINDSANMQILSGLYNSTGAVINGKNELNDNVPWVSRQAPSSDQWYAKPWLGELYPLAHSGTAPQNPYTTYGTYGNLPSGSNNYLFTRSPIATPGAFSNIWDKLSDKTSANDSKWVRQTGSPTNASMPGLGSFLNLSGGPAFCIKDTSNNSTTLTTGTPPTVNGSTAATDFGLVLQALDADYSYKLTGGANSTETGYPWYSSNREPAVWLQPNAYFTSQHGTGFAASQALVLTDGVNYPGGDRRAYFMANTFKPASLNLMQSVMNNAITITAQAYYDGTQIFPGGLTSRFNNKPTPQIQITNPASAAVLSGGTVNVTWTRAWKRPNGQEYVRWANYNPGLAVTAGGPFPVYYYLKYKSLTTGGAWKMAKLTAPVSVTYASAVQDGISLPSATVPPMADTATGCTWDISALPAGDYLLRLEAFRYDTTLPGTDKTMDSNYAFHEIKVTK